MTHPNRILAAASLLAALVWLAPERLVADHDWDGYHWSRTSNPVSLTVGDNVTAAWDGYLSTALADWDDDATDFGFSDVLELALVPGAAGSRNCKPGTGRIEVCHGAYGFNGWLGVAQIWLDRAGHITQASMRMNDSYFALATYDTPAVRLFVVCQEIGHTFGLDHQDETFENANLGSCMDYTDHPEGTATEPANTTPNAHDFAMLEAIYAHLDQPSGGGGGGGGGRGRGGAGAPPDLLPDLPLPSPGNSPASWGALVRANRATARYELDLGNGRRMVTFVILAV